MANNKDKYCFIQSIKNDFKRVIEYSQDNCHVSDDYVDTVLKVWARNKSHLIDLMGGKLIVELPGKRSFSLGDKAKKRKYNDFLDYIVLRANNYELCKFVEEQGMEAFYDNTTVKPYTTRDNTFIPVGSKVVRSFKLFIGDKDLLEATQNEASRIIQGDCVEGILCISVHPLDFLSMSETTYNWRSCHALDGEYRAGDISYMMDKTTFICYLRGDDSQKLPDFPEDVHWNSKKWRCLGFLEEHDNGVIMGRPYPYEAMDVIEELRWSVFNRMWGMGLGAWHDDTIRSIKDKCSGWDTELNKTYVPWSGSLMVFDDSIHDCPEPTHYNDLLLSSCYMPIYAFRRGPAIGKDGWKNLNYYIGHEVPCMICNSNPVSGGNGTLLCNDCEITYGNSDNTDIVYCSCCGARGWYDEMTIVGDPGEYVCADCLPQGARECEDCGCWYFINEMTYHENEDYYLCAWCERDRADKAKEEEARQPSPLPDEGPGIYSLDEHGQWIVQPRREVLYYTRNDNGEWTQIDPHFREITVSTNEYNEHDFRNLDI